MTVVGGVDDHTELLLIEAANVRLGQGESPRVLQTFQIAQTDLRDGRRIDVGVECSQVLNGSRILGVEHDGHSPSD
jgi:hypothetical protein